MALKKSITARFVFVIFALLLAGQILGTILFVLNTRASLSSSLELRIQRISAFAAGVTAMPLLSHDYVQIDSYMEEIIKDEEITGIRILDRGGNLVRERTKSGTLQQGSDFGFENVILSIKTPVLFSGEKIGQITVDYHTGKINQEISGSVLVISIYQLTLLIAVGFMMIFLFRRNITRPVAAINKAIEKITMGDLSTPVPETGDDEIGEIAKGIAFLESRLSTTISKLNSTAVNVAMATKQVDHTYNNVIEGITTQTGEIKNIIGSIQHATKSQFEISDSTEKLSGFSAENVASLQEVKETAGEISSNIQRLFKATEDSYSVVVQMSQSGKTIAGIAANASSAVEDTSASVEQVGASVREVEEHAAESSRLAEKVQEITSGAGMMSVVNAVEGMDNISEEVKKSADIIRRLGIRSTDIEKILSVIRDVTEQTNLLSLNAAILAAQAGEYGKSFSVVADEIRGLSERTSVSTREIGGIVKTIQQDIRDAIHTIDSAQEKVEEGNSLVLNVGAALREILNASIKSTEMTKAIERATEEQSIGLKQITSAVEEIRRMMNGVAKSTKEQDNALSFLLEGTGEVKEVAEVSKRGSLEQADGIKMIYRNIELANERVNQINHAISAQKNLNDSIIRAMEKIGNTGTSTVRDMEEVSQSLKTLSQEIETLKQDMSVFKIK
jgi:methyl-accepting chemotaxis protein